MKKFKGTFKIALGVVLSLVVAVGVTACGGGSTTDSEIVSIWGNDEKTLTFYDDNTWEMDYENGNVLSGSYKENSETSYELEIKKRKQVNDNSFGWILTNTNSFSARISDDCMKLKYIASTFEFLYKQ